MSTVQQSYFDYSAVKLNLIRTIYFFDRTIEIITSFSVKFNGILNRRAKLSIWTVYFTGSIFVSLVPISLLTEEIRISPPLSFSPLIGIIWSSHGREREYPSSPHWSALETYIVANLSSFTRTGAPSLSLSHLRSHPDPSLSLSRLRPPSRPISLASPPVVSLASVVRLCPRRRSRLAAYCLHVILKPNFSTKFLKPNFSTKFLKPNFCL